MHGHCGNRKLYQLIELYDKAPIQNFRHTKTTALSTTERVWCTSRLGSPQDYSQTEFSLATRWT